MITQAGNRYPSDSPERSPQSPSSISLIATRFPLPNQQPQRKSKNQQPSFNPQKPYPKTRHSRSVSHHRRSATSRGNSNASETRSWVRRTGPSNLSARAGTSSTPNPASLAMSWISVVRDGGKSRKGTRPC